LTYDSIVLRPFVRRAGELAQLDLDPIKTESDQGLDFKLVHDLFRKPVSTHQVKPEGMLFGIMH
jgi:hypothetical protein